MSARRTLAALTPITLLPTALIALTATRGRAFTWPDDASDPLAGVTSIAAAGAWTIAAWWTLATAVAVLGRMPGQLGHTAATVARRITPTAVRGFVAAVSGAALASSAAPAFAAAPPLPPAPGIALPAPTEPSTAGGSRTVLVLPSPTEPSGADGTGVTAAPHPPAPPSPSDRLPRSHVRIVHSGECLWSIAADELGHEASVPAVAQRWPDWWAANREVIGADPAHLVPGEQLAVPSASAA